MTDIKCRVDAGSVAALKLDGSTKVAVSVCGVRLESTSYIHMKVSRIQREREEVQVGEEEQQT